MTRLLARLLAALALAGTASLQAATGPFVLGEPALAPKSVAIPRLHLGAGAKAATAAARVELTPPDAADLALLRARNESSAGKKRMAIGLTRALERTARIKGTDVPWTSVDGGAATRVSVTSSGAKSLRVGIELAGVPLDVQMVFFGSADAARLFGPVRVGDIPDRTQAFWSPLTEGDTQTVEFFAPGGASADAKAFVVSGAAHLFTAPSTGLAKASPTDNIGQSGLCNVDVACSPLVTSLPFDDAVGAVAEMVFNDAQFSYICTGSLLNDSDPASQVPWFFSANHCFDNESAPFKTPSQMQVIANTLTTVWHFEANACHSGTPNPAWTQVSGGAQYLYSNPQQDALFIRLNNPPPAGAYYLGWDASTVATGTGVTVLHHPSGDLKKVSIGSVLGLTHPADFNEGGTLSFYQVGYSSGTTEGGSSGSPLLTNNGSQYLVRGALWGGLAACDMITASDWYSRFDLIYPSIAQYLGNNGSAVDYTDLWWGGDSQSGWGLNLIQHGSRNIFAVWYTYDAQGHRTWYVISGGTWTSNNTFTGTIYATSGPPASAATFDPNSVKVRSVGEGTLTFNDANSGTFAFIIDGVSGAKFITRQPF